MKKSKGLSIHLEKEKLTVEPALNLQTAAPVITIELMMRYLSLADGTFTGKGVAAIRNEIGGHEVLKK